MKLSALIRALSGLAASPPPQPDPSISDVAYRSGAVTAGALFVAIPGSRADGHDFVDDAVARGAAAVIVERPVPASVPQIRVADGRRALAEAAAAFYGHPSAELTLVGITGTNGKTTTVTILEHLLTAAGHATGVIGTLGYRFGGTAHPLPVTTPESRDLQEILRRMRDADVTHVVMEVSSHAIDQDRVWGCRFDVGGFTNLSHDHLDYHGDMAAYGACKQRWFIRNLSAQANGKPAAAVINTRDAWGDMLATRLRRDHPRRRVITVNRSSPADISAGSAAFRRDGLTASVVMPDGETPIGCPLVGAHNLDNVLGAVGVCHALGIPASVAAAALTTTPQVPGRLEAVPTADGKAVFVDYAHTPDALENVLATLRAVTGGRLLCVFGCGGDRDRDKRPVMGAIAGRLADLTVITADNPRTESTAAILDGIAEGIRPVCHGRFAPWAPPDTVTAPGFTIEPNRMAAIRIALGLMRAEDVLLIAGKGHETYQIIGTHTIAFDDRQAAIRAASPAAAAHCPAPDRPLPWTGDRILEATGGMRLQTATPGRSIPGVTTDTRRLAGGECFVALCGDTHDGHDFIPTAIDAGAGAVVMDAARADDFRPLLRRHPAVDVIAVENPQTALGRLAAYHRVRTGVPVAAVTGSNGKTSTRAMIAAVVSRAFETLATSGNLNNEIGLPLTLLQATPRHQWAVLEMGMNHAGEISRLAAIAAPAVGVVTNIGPAHLEFLGSLEGVMHAKGELLEALAPDALAVINGDDPFADALASKCACPVTTFGLAPRHTVRAADVTATDAGIAFTLMTPEGAAAVQLPVPGRFNVLNALAAAAVGRHLGIAPEAIAAGLAGFSPVGGRMRRVPMKNGVTLIDDSYNANPGSMAAAIASLSELAGGADTHLVMGDMRELGPQADTLHREIGQKAAACGISYLYATGDHAADAADGAAAGGMAAARIATGSQEQLLAVLSERLTAGGWVLLKGSRAMGMERMISGIADLCGGPVPTSGGKGG